MADAGPMILKSLAAQQGEPVYVPDGHDHLCDLSWYQPSEPPLEPSDHGLEQHEGFSLPDQLPVVEGAD